MKGKVGFAGTLGIKVNRMTKAPLSWRLRNTMRWDYIRGYLANRAAKAFSKLTGVPTLTSQLSAILIKADGTRIDYGILGYRVVTDAFCEFMVDEMQADTGEFGDFKFHDSGEGFTGENVTDTDIETTDNEARDTGTQVEGATAEIYRSVGTITYSGALTLREHGLFSTIAAPTLLDRTVFAAIGVVNLDSVQFTYELTCTAGG